ncbi:hypothetical protein ACQPW1_11240 [Nocardia sp. CA-128927]|uniref:LmrA/YxaF family transcription factor n=1 Tax=Nocardia sp. CA-128927 TaxID=3239975 RepID=UPI003D9968BB
MYYLFPGGKEELAVAAIAESAAEFTDLIRETMAQSGDSRGFCEILDDRLSEGLVRTGYLGGSPVSAVTLDSTPRSAALTVACRETYRQWRAALAAALVRYGAPADRAARLATLMLSAVEGALIIARAECSTEPLEDIRPDLVDLATAATEM